MKRFMYLSIGVLCLSVSALIGFHVGSSNVQAGPDAGKWALFQGKYRAISLDEDVGADMEAVFLLNTETGKSFTYAEGIGQGRRVAKWVTTESGPE